MQIGLIGGIGPAATDYYYRRLIERFASENENLDMTIVHADAPRLLKNLETGNYDEQVGIYERLTDRLQKAGADCVAVTSIAGHFCIDQFKPVSALPVVDMLLCVGQEVRTKGYKRVGLIGTKTVMESKFYKGIPSADVCIPEGELLDKVHRSYVTMAKSGSATEEQRTIFDEACEELLTKDEVDAIVLGGTDLALVYSSKDTGFAVVDCAQVHVDALFELYKEQTQN